MSPAHPWLASQCLLRREDLILVADSSRILGPLGKVEPLLSGAISTGYTTTRYLLFSVHACDLFMLGFALRARE